MVVFIIAAVSPLPVQRVDLGVFFLPCHRRNVLTASRRRRGGLFVSAEAPLALNPTEPVFDGWSLARRDAVHRQNNVSSSRPPEVREIAAMGEIW